MKDRLHHTTFQLMLWSATWLLTAALATFGPRFLWGSNRMLTLLAILINVGVGGGMILANRSHLKANDELQQKIQLEAMAVALGASLVGGIACAIMDQSDLISGDASMSNLIAFMAIMYMVSIVIGKIRYS